jgi:NitT/TauT family transport system permease protein
VTVADASGTAGGGASAPRRRPHRRRRVVNWKPSRSTSIFLGLLPFLIIVIVYAVASADRLAINPQDRLLPSLGSMWDAFRTYAFTPDVRSGDYLLWSDTLASLKRLVTALVISAGLAISLGISIGFLPMVRAGLAPFVAAISLIPPLAVLPILFLLLGLGDTAKIALIVIGMRRSWCAASPNRSARSRKSRSSRPKPLALRPGRWSPASPCRRQCRISSRRFASRSGRHGSS